MKKLLFIVNKPSAFISHRLPIAIKARSEGYDVHIAGQYDAISVNYLEGMGFIYHNLPLTRSGLNPFIELRALISIWLLLWKIRPEVLHLVTIKPALYGGLSSRLSPVKGVVAALAGLGYIFMSKSMIVKLIRGIVVRLLKLSFLDKNTLLIFQNRDDEKLMVDLGVVSISKTKIIRGSGVNLTEYSYSPERLQDSIVVTFASRLLFDKGIQEYVDAAIILKNRKIDAVFKIIGDPDFDNPTSVTNFDLIKWGKFSNIVIEGYREDIASVFSESNIVVLPSYREGLPKVLIEAAACGRAVVTTDVPGCRDAIIPDVTGLLVPVKDAIALANAIEKLILDSELRFNMGLLGRAYAEDCFDISNVVDQHLAIYNAIVQ